MIFFDLLIFENNPASYIQYLIIYTIITKFTTILFIVYSLFFSQTGQVKKQTDLKRILFSFDRCSAIIL